jgi:hypothetical protein
MRRIKRLSLLLGVLMILDILTTWLLMTQYGASEAVPTSRWLIDRGWLLFAAVKMATVMVAGVHSVWAVKLRPSLYKPFNIALTAACVFYVTPVVWNVYGMMVLNGWVEIPSWM